MCRSELPPNLRRGGVGEHPGRKARSVTDTKVCTQDYRIGASLERRRGGSRPVGLVAILGRMRRDVFLSVGATYTSQQEEFVQGLESLLRDLGLNPRCLGRTEWSDEQPLLAIRRMMENCHGVVVLAFERTRIEAGREKPGSANETVLGRCSLPTVWNQIEASMAYALDKPLLVLCAKGLRVEGLLEGRYDWYVQRIDMELEATNTREFRGVLEAWKSRLGANATGRRLQALDPGKLSLAELLGTLRPGQARIAAAAVFAVVAGISAGSFWLGQHLSLQGDATEARQDP